MTSSVTDASRLNGQTVLIVGGGSGIGTAIARHLDEAGVTPVLASRHPDPDDTHRTVRMDLSDEASIASAATQLGAIDHVVSLAANHANGPVAELEPDAIRRAFEAKVTGPILLAKHLIVRPGGSFVLFSGIAAWKPAPGLSVMATTNGAVAFLAQALAVELAPIRVNALSPGIVDSGAWDDMGEQKNSFFETTAQSNPARRVGTVDDIADATLALMRNGFVTGTVAHVDGGGRLV